MSGSGSDNDISSFLKLVKTVEQRSNTNHVEKKSNKTKRKRNHKESRQDDVSNTLELVNSVEDYPYLTNGDDHCETP